MERWFDDEGAQDYHHTLIGPEIRAYALLKNKIAAGENLWEKIEPSVICFFEGTDLKIVVYLDGKCAPGPARFKPSDARYVDLEPKHSDQLQRYCQRILYHLIQDIEQG